jgi:hypothetical protein
MREHGAPQEKAEEPTAPTIADDDRNQTED